MATAGSDGQLNVQVGTTYNSSGLDAATRELQGFTRETATASQNISRNVANINRQNFTAFSAAAQAGTLQINKLGAASNQVSQQLAKSAAGTNQAAFALTNLSRVAQDAPFGFIGIQNNLNPLLESFQRLRQETGSNSAAIKALGQSLIGPAGLGLALSLVSSAILIYQQFQLKSKKADEEKEKAQRKLIDSNKEYFDSLSQVEQASVKGNQDAQREIISLQHLYFAARNVALSSDERHKAAKALQDQYPNTFKNFTQEEIALGKASSAYKELSKDIFSVARAAAATDIIIENTKKLTLEQLKYTKAQKELVKVNEQLANQPRTDNRAAGAGIGASNAAFSTTKATNDLLSKQAELQNTLNQSQKTKTSLVKQNLDLEKLVTGEIKTQGVTAITGIDKTLDKARTASKEINKLELPDNPAKIFEDLFKKVSNINAPGALTVKAPEKLTIDTSGTTFDIQGLETNQKKLRELIQKSGIETEIFKMGEGAESAITNLFKLPTLVSTLSSSLYESFDAMGQAIASGGNALAAAGKVLQGVVGGIMSSLGQQLITLGSAKVAAGILATPFGAKLVAEGTGLIAIGAGLTVAGSIVKNAGQSNSEGSSSFTPVRQFADGGIISTPTYGLMGEYPGARSNPEVVAPLNKLKDMIGDRGQTTVIVGETSISMEQFVIKFKQQEKRMGRLG